MTKNVLTLCVAAALLAACGKSGPEPLQGYVEGEYVRVAAPFAAVTIDVTVVARSARTHTKEPQGAREVPVPRWGAAVCVWT